MPEDADKKQEQKKTRTDNVRPYLDHGVPSLIAMDNPDDFQFRDEKAPKRGSRR